MMNPKQQTLHMIGNAHIDPVWLWQWHEGFQEVKATFRSALDRMTEYDDFIFVASSAALYEWIEKSDPAMFAEIRQRIVQGRWQVVGGWWIEPDCNIPSGESFVRQGLYGQRYFKDKFGVFARVGFNVDSFGHAPTLPQILKKSGLPYYNFLRPMPHEKSLPSRLFWWESDDGSRVLAFRIPFEYLSWPKAIDHHVRRCADEMKAPIDEFMCFYGVGNHGGGPTIENLESIKRMQSDPNYPNIVLSSPEAFFKAVEAKDWNLPVVHSDMQNHACGCYSVHSGIKRWNRQAEHRLVTAEKWSTIAQLVTDQPYPDDFDRAWKSVLFNQFHDILAGTSLEPAYDDARDSYGEARAIADRALNFAVQSLAWNVRIEQDTGVRPIVVFNPHTWDVHTNVELEVNKLRGMPVLVDDQDKPIPYQQVQSVTVTDRARISFNADLPALGYRTYRLLPEGTLPVANTVEASDTVLENQRLRLEIDPQTGYVSSLYDKQAGVQVFADAAAKPVVITDTWDTWGHNAFRFDDVAGAFMATNVLLAEHGPVKSVIRVFSEYNNSSLIQDFIMYPASDYLEVQAVVDWREPFKMLKIRFPVNVKFMKVTHEVAYGHMELYANGDEVPFHSWVDLSGISRDIEIPYGFSLLNDSKYSMDVYVRDIGMTILRSVPYAHHIPAQVEPGRLVSLIDQGIQRFSYIMLPHTDSWERSSTVQRAAELNQRPFALMSTFHPNGTLPQSDSYIHVEPDNVVVTVLKQAFDNDDIIVRAYETTKTLTQATIHLPKLNRTIEVRFGPSEIKTFRIPRDISQPVTETDLLEYPING